MLSKEEFKNYFDHTLGINLLNIWIKQHQIPIDVNKKEIIIPIGLANLFKIDLPKGKESFFSFLAERDEINWLQRIGWERMVIDIVKKKFILISKRVEGDKKTLCDIPPIAISIPYDLTKKIRLLGKEKRLNIKEIYIEDNNISLSRVLANKIPLFFIQDKIENYLTTNEMLRYTTNKDLLEGNIQRTNSFNDKYLGSQYGVQIPSGLGYLTKPFDFNTVSEEAKSLGENVQSAEIYKEFSNKEYSYGAWFENNYARNEQERNENNQKYKWW